MATTDRHSEEIRTFAHLAGLLAADFPREVLNRRLRIVVGPGVLEHAAGQALVLTVARLAPRFCHRIDFLVPGHNCISRLRPLLAASAFSSGSLAQLAGLIWPDGEFTGSAGGVADVVLGIGAPGDISVGIAPDGSALVARDQPVSVDRGDAMFAALVAAGLACAETSNVLYPEIVRATGRGVPSSEVRIAGGPLGGLLDPQAPITLDRPVLVGVGAVGCAVVYALVVVGATGELLLLDPDIVNDSNLMRYVFFDVRHLGRPKVAAAAELVEAAGVGLTIEFERDVIQEYLRRNPSERDRLALVASAVDTYQARREIAGELPRHVVNAGTTPHDFTISRHGLADGFACLACLYPAQAADVEMAAVIARELGIEKGEVEELRRTRAPLTHGLLERVSLARGLDRGRYAHYVGEPIESFYNKEVCGRRPIATRRGEAVAPLAFGSALAGFFLARSLADPTAIDHRRFRMDFVNGLASPMRTSPRQRRNCLCCGREAMRWGYARRWSAAG